VDTVIFQDPLKSFSQLLQQLREKVPTFKNIILWHEPTSTQSFIVNGDLLMQTYRMLQRNDLSNSEHPWTTFVRLEHPPTVLPCAPETGILQALENMSLQIAGDHPISLTGLEGFNQEIMIPLAAILLEYPVAYVPSSAHQNVFLSGEPLDIYECLLIHIAGGTAVPKQHTFLKFSCPSAVSVEKAELSPCVLVERMKERFIPRLQSANCNLTLDIRVSTESFDRVAL